MKHKGVSARDLAAESGVNYQPMVNILNANGKAMLGTMILICNFLDLQNPLELYKTQYIKG